MSTGLHQWCALCTRRCTLLQYRTSIARDIDIRIDDTLYRFDDNSGIFSCRRPNAGSAIEIGSNGASSIVTAAQHAALSFAPAIDPSMVLRPVVPRAMPASDATATETIDHPVVHA
jgi:hypothetical protein